MTESKPKYLREFTDRHGRVRRYFRYRGKSTAIPYEPGTPEFDGMYAELLDGRGNTTFDSSRRGFVYFIQGESGRIKIGFSAEPYKRLAALQTGHPERLSILCLMRGTTNDERRLHIRFARQRITGEWFKPTKKLLEIIGQEKAA